jgi:hypothetical protein
MIIAYYLIYKCLSITVNMVSNKTVICGCVDFAKRKYVFFDQSKDFKIWIQRADNLVLDIWCIPVGYIIRFKRSRVLLMCFTWNIIVQP